jgi:hypothetical protein
MNSNINQSLETFKIIYNDILIQIKNNEDIIIPKYKIKYISNILPYGNHEWKYDHLHYNVIIEENNLICFQNGLRHGLSIHFESILNYNTMFYSIYNKGYIHIFVKYYDYINQIFSYSNNNINSEVYKQWYKNGNIKINRSINYYNALDSNLRCFNTIFNNVKYCTKKNDFIQKYYENGNIKKEYSCSNNKKTGFFKRWNTKQELIYNNYYYNNNCYILPDDLLIIIKLQTQFRKILKKIRLLKWFKSKSFNEWWWNPSNTGGKWVKNSLFKIVNLKKNLQNDFIY